jgi:two-component system response regulator AtoC
MELAISCRTSTWIVGPPGCQKSKVARGIWAARARANGWSVAQSPCLPIQCELMDREMLSGMLEMLTNRVREEKGHACLLLEHIDRLPEEVHGTLLRFLDTAPACQCLATSSLTPEACTTGRPGMYPIVSRTSTLVCHVPSLAQRPRDLAPIAEAILDQWAKESNGTTKQLAAQTLTLLQAYPWQGNVEELTEALRESAGRAPNRWIEPSHLPIAMRTFPSFVERDDGPPRTIDLDRFLEETERRILKRALELHRGNRSSAARSLNISRARFLRRLEQLGLRSVPSAQDATAEESTRAVPVTSAPAASDPASSAQDETGRAPEANKDNAWAPSKPVPDPNSELTMISDDWAEEHFKEFEKDE